MENFNTTKIVEHFSCLEDERIIGRTDHKLIDIIIITICAVICGSDEWTEIEAYGKAKKEWLKTFLELPNGIPSHDTFGRVFSIIQPDKFSDCFINWVNSVFIKTEGQVIAIDGKTLRRSHNRSKNKSAIHMVSAWASENKIVLGQIKTDEKSNEITAIPELLNLLEIKGCIVTIDAMGCQKNIAQKIVEKEADYILSLKGNQGKLHDDVISFFEKAEKENFKNTDFDYHKTTDNAHGRKETRKHWTVCDIEWLNGKKNWKNLNGIGMVESTREIGNKTETEKRYYIFSIKDKAEKFAKSVREHWGIENKVHWILDIAFREDDSRIRTGNAPENLTVIRHIALNLLKQEKTIKRGTKAKRKVAGWNNDYLLKLLSCG